MMENRNIYKEALEQIKNVMGPFDIHTKSCITCEGCQFEWQETLQIIENVLAGKDIDDHWGEPVQLNK